MKNFFLEQTDIEKDPSMRPIERCKNMFNGVTGFTFPTDPADSSKAVKAGPNNTDKILVKYKTKELDVHVFFTDMAYRVVPVFLLKQLVASYICEFMNVVDNDTETETVIATKIANLQNKINDSVNVLFSEQTNVVDHVLFSKQTKDVVDQFYKRALELAKGDEDQETKLNEHLNVYDSSMRLLLMEDPSKYAFSDYLFDVKIVANALGGDLAHDFRDDHFSLLNNIKQIDNFDTNHFPHLESIRRRSKLHPNATVYFMSDLEGRYHVLLECLVMSKVITITNTGVIKWNDKEDVWVFNCGDAVDDSRWTYNETGEIQPDLIGRDLDALLVLDYLRRISKGRFINIIGNHDLASFQGDAGYDEYNILSKYPNAMYKVDGVELKRKEFIDKFIIPFHSMNFMYVLTTESHDFVMSHAGFNADKIDTIQKRTFADPDMDLMNEVHTPQNLKDYFKKSDVPINSFSRLYQEMECFGKPDLESCKEVKVNELNIELAIQRFFSSDVNVIRSVVQVIGHNKDANVRIMALNKEGRFNDTRRSTAGNPNPSVILSSSKTPPEVIVCMVDALQHTMNPTSVEILKFTTTDKKLEILELKPEYNMDTIRNLRTMLYEMYKVEKGAKKDASEDNTRPT